MEIEPLVNFAIADIAMGYMEDAVPAAASFMKDLAERWETMTPQARTNSLVLFAFPLSFACCAGSALLALKALGK